MLLTPSQVNHRIETQRLIQRSKCKSEFHLSLEQSLEQPERINPVKNVIKLVKTIGTAIVIASTAFTLGCGEPQTEQERWRSIAWKHDPVCRERINDATIEYQRLRNNAWQNGHLTGKISVEQFHAIKDALLADLRRKQALIYHDSITQLRKEQNLND